VSAPCKACAGSVRGVRFSGAPGGSLQRRRRLLPLRPPDRGSSSAHATTGSARMPEGVEENSKDSSHGASSLTSALRSCPERPRRTEEMDPTMQKLRGFARALTLKLARNCRDKVT